MEVIGYFGFIRARYGGRRVYSSAICVLSVSFGFVGLSGVRPGSRRFHFGSFGPFVRSLVVVGIIRMRSAWRWFHSVSFGRGKWLAFWYVRFVPANPGSRWVHSGAHLGSSGSFGLTGFTRALSGIHSARHVCCRVLSS